MDGGGGGRGVFVCVHGRCAGGLCKQCDACGSGLPALPYTGLSCPVRALRGLGRSNSGAATG